MSPPRLLQLHQVDPGQLAAEAIAGLLRTPAAVSPKFFYDALGSRLFDAITALDEYDLTRNEAAIFAEQGPAIIAAVHAAIGPHPVMVDLGAGNCAKAERLLGALQPARYVAVDISTAFLQESLAGLHQRHPGLELVGLGLDFSQDLNLPLGLVDQPALLFYPGSSIGNFTPEQALPLLASFCRASAGGALLIGVDLHKTVARMEQAYDDPLGVTASFNRNLLRHLNHLIGSNFDLRNWAHRAHFNADASRIEMHLEAREACSVQWPGGRREFAAGERLHTENACKWRADDFQALLHDAGFGAVQTWTDAAGDFAVMLAQAAR